MTNRSRRISVTALLCLALCLALSVTGAKPVAAQPTPDSTQCASWLATLRAGPVGTDAEQIHWRISRCELAPSTVTAARRAAIVSLANQEHPASLVEAIRFIDYYDETWPTTRPSVLTAIVRDRARSRPVRAAVLFAIAYQARPGDVHNWSRYLATDSFNDERAQPCTAGLVSDYHDFRVSAVEVDEYLRVADAILADSTESPMLVSAASCARAALRIAKPKPDSSQTDSARAIPCSARVANLSRSRPLPSELLLVMMCKGDPTQLVSALWAQSAYEPRAMDALQRGTLGAANVPTVDLMTKIATTDPVPERRMAALGVLANLVDPSIVIKSGSNAVSYRDVRGGLHSAFGGNAHAAMGPPELRETALARIKRLAATSENEDTRSAARDLLESFEVAASLHTQRKVDTLPCDAWISTIAKGASTDVEFQLLYKIDGCARSDSLVMAARNAGLDVLLGRTDIAGATRYVGYSARDDEWAATTMTAKLLPIVADRSRAVDLRAQMMQLLASELRSVRGANRNAYFPPAGSPSAADVPCTMNGTVSERRPTRLTQSWADAIKSVAESIIADVTEPERLRSAARCLRAAAADPDR